MTVQVFTYAISPYEDWHRQAWAGALVLVTIVLICSLLARIATAARVARSADRTMARDDESARRRPTASLRDRAIRAQRRLPHDETLKIDVEQLSFFYGDKRALEDISIKIHAECRHRVHRSVRLRQEHVSAHAQPDERHHSRRARRGRGLHRRRGHLRRRASTSWQCAARSGMVFQKSNPFPKSIFENVAYGLRINRMTVRSSRSSPGASKRA